VYLLKKWKRILVTRLKLPALFTRYSSYNDCSNLIYESRTILTLGIGAYPALGSRLPHPVGARVCLSIGYNTNPLNTRERTIHWDHRESGTLILLAEYSSSSVTTQALYQNGFFKGTWGLESSPYTSISFHGVCDMNADFGYWRNPVATFLISLGHILFICRHAAFPNGIQKLMQTWPVTMSSKPISRRDILAFQEQTCPSRSMN